MDIVRTEINLGFTHVYLLQAQIEDVQKYVLEQGLHPYSQYGD